MPRSPEREGELDDALLLLHFGYRRIIEEPDRILARRGLGRMHHRILYFVRRYDGASVGELLAKMEIRRQSLHGPMRALVEAGLVVSVRSPKSRRTKVLTLSPEGLRLEQRLSGMQRDAFARAFAKLPRAGERAWQHVMQGLGAAPRRGPN